MGSVSVPGYPEFPGEPEHEVLAFVLPQARLAFEAATELLADLARTGGAQFATHEWRGVSDRAAAYGDEWMVEVSAQEGDDVAADLKDMAGDCYAGHPRAAEIAACRRRVDVWVFDPAAHVTAFECLDGVREWLKAQPGVVVIHPDTGEPL
jgi:hypothetical protein